MLHRKDIVRPFLVCMVWACLSIASPATAKDPAQVRKDAIMRMGSTVRRCSIRHNERSLKGPVKLRIVTDDDGNPDEIQLLTKRHAGSDLAKCLQRPSRMSGPGKVPSVTFTHDFAFHPWADRSRRKWAVVRRAVVKAGVVDAVQKCADAHDEREPWMKTHTHFFIQPSGKIRPVVKSTPPMNACLERAFARLKPFRKAGNKFVVSFVLKKGASKPVKLEGNTVEPLDCELERRPCSFAASNPQRTAWALKLMDKARKQKHLSCKNITSVAAWLRKQKHVDKVLVDGCTMVLEVEGTRPIWYGGHER